jgi:predicted nucleic acid-binding protein
MSFLVDTNLLLRSSEPEHPMYEDAVNAIDILLNRGEQLCIISQNLIEFWNVCTRPIERNGLGRTLSEAEAEIYRLKGIFDFLPDTPTIYQEWERLVIVYGVRGVNVHDARLVAAMLVHRLTHILTFNTSDFVRYSEVITKHPTEFTSNEC